MSGTALSDDDMEYLRETISNAICTLQNEYVHLAGRPDCNEGDLTAIEEMEIAVNELECADALLEARIAKLHISRAN